MTKEKFTSGEWDIHHQDCCVEIMAGRVTIYFEPYPTMEELANAQLIAAAPEMYDMLSSLLAVGQHPKDEERIEKLLAKARGEINGKES